MLEEENEWHQIRLLIKPHFVHVKLSHEENS